MKWLTNNFSLNMVNVTKDYSMDVTHLSELAFKVESKTAKNRLSQIDVCQELGLFPSPGIVDADDSIVEGDIVIIVEETHNKPLAMGISLISGPEMVENSEGKAIKSLHYVGDAIWNLEV